MDSTSLSFSHKNEIRLQSSLLWLNHEVSANVMYRRISFLESQLEEVKEKERENERENIKHRRVA
jgi:hypothetical protein